MRDVDGSDWRIHVNDFMIRKLRMYTQSFTLFIISFALCLSELEIENMIWHRASFSEELVSLYSSRHWLMPEQTYCLSRTCKIYGWKYVPWLYFSFSTIFTSNEEDVMCLFSSSRMEFDAELEWWGIGIEWNGIYKVHGSDLETSFGNVCTKHRKLIA